MKVTGSVSGGQYCAGIVGAAQGSTNIIRNCWMAAAVRGQGNIGGILGHGTTSSITISNCYLTGSLSANDIGVLCGGGSNGGTFVLETCWAMGKYTKSLNAGSLNLIFTDSGATVSITDCRHNSDLITQGGQYTLIGLPSEVDNTLVNFLGNQWTAANEGVMLNPSASYDETDITDPVFTGVTISDAAVPVETNYIDFVGITSPFTISGEDHTKLYLGAASTLYYPTAAMTINACRAYFQLKNGVTIGDSGSGANTIRSFVLNFGGDGDATGVASRPTPDPSRDGGEVFDLAGRKIDVIPPAPGLYIVNGKKIYVK